MTSKYKALLEEYNTKLTSYLFSDSNESGPHVVAYAEIMLELSVKLYTQVSSSADPTIPMDDLLVSKMLVDPFSVAVDYSSLFRIIEAQKVVFWLRMLNLSDRYKQRQTVTTIPNMQCFSAIKDLMSAPYSRKNLFEQMNADPRSERETYKMIDSLIQLEKADRGKECIVVKTGFTWGYPYSQKRKQRICGYRNAISYFLRKFNILFAKKDEKNYDKTCTDSYDGHMKLEVDKDAFANSLNALFKTPSSPSPNLRIVFNSFREFIGFDAMEPVTEEMEKKMDDFFARFYPDEEKPEKWDEIFKRNITWFTLLECMFLNGQHSTGVKTSSSAAAGSDDLVEVSNSSASFDQIRVLVDGTEAAAEDTKKAISKIEDVKANTQNSYVKPAIERVAANISKLSELAFEKASESKLALDAANAKAKELKLALDSANQIVPNALKIADDAANKANLQADNAARMIDQSVSTKLSSKFGESVSRRFDLNPRTVGGRRINRNNSKKMNKKPRRWSLKYKKNINCNRPRGFSQRQYCKYGKKYTKTHKL